MLSGRQMGYQGVRALYRIRLYIGQHTTIYNYLIIIGTGLVFQYCFHTGTTKVDRSRTARPAQFSGTILKNDPSYVMNVRVVAFNYLLRPAALNSQQYNSRC